MSQHADIIDRLRAAKPARVASIDNAALWAQVVASPSDPRLDAPRPSPQPGRIGWRQRRPRRGALLVSVLIVGGCGTAGLAAVFNDGTSQFARVTPLQLFSANPGRWNPQYGPNRRTGVIAASIRNLETINIPGVAPVQYWIARTSHGGLCSAFRLPDGVWAGTEVDTKYNFSGAVPVCEGSATYSFGPHFSYTTGYFSLNPPHPNGPLPGPRSWTVAYGVVLHLAQAVQVRDIKTGATTRVFDGRDFALLLPSHLVLGRNTPGGCSCGPHARIWFTGPIRLEALDAAGHVIGRASTGP